MLSASSRVFGSTQSLSVRYNSNSLNHLKEEINIIGPQPYSMNGGVLKVSLAFNLIL